MKLFENKIIVSFGDSVMKGIVTESEKSCESGQMRYVISENSFTSICEKRLGARISNFGRFGNTVRRGLRDVRRHFMQVEGAQYALLEIITGRRFPRIRTVISLPIPNPQNSLKDTRNCLRL